MKNLTVRSLSLLLLAALVLGLAACGQGEPAAPEAPEAAVPETAVPETAGETVFVPEQASLPTDLGLITNACLVGDDLYYLTAAREELQREYAGFSFTDTVFRFRLYRGGLGEDAAEELSAFQPDALPEDKSGSVSVSFLSSCGDGGLWLQETVNTYGYDLPEDFDPELDDRWDYRTESETARFCILLDENGTEQRRVDLNALASDLGLDLENLFFFYPAFDGEGNLYLTTQEALYVYDSQLKPLFTLEGQTMNDAAVPLADGGMAQYGYVSSAAGGSDQLRRIDLAAKAWGESVELPSGVYEVYGGSGDFRFFYGTGEGLYGWETDSGQARQLFTWLDADIDQSGMALVHMLPDGRLAVLSRDWETDQEGNRPLCLNLMTETDSALAPKDGRTVLTLGTIYLWTETEKAVQAFNRSNDQYVIQVRNYSEIADGDSQAASTLLRTELIAGKVPDILYADSVPLLQMETKGMLEDLWPWIERDPDLGRDALMTHVLDTASLGGKLYHVFDSFEIETVKGAASVVGDRMGWTVEDMLAAWATMPEGCCLMSPYVDDRTALNYLLEANLDEFVDWDRGECRFDIPEFRSLLELCTRFTPETYEYDPDFSDQTDLLVSGQQMLAATTVYNFDDIQMDEVIFGGAVSYIGFPSLDGGNASCFRASSMGQHYAMSASCRNKEGAWAFIRQALLPQYAGQSLEGQPRYSKFCVNRADFEWMAKKAMTPLYKTDKQGNTVLNDEGEPIEISILNHGRGHISVDIYATSQEEYDQIMALYNATDRMAEQDSTLYELIFDRATAYFNGDKSLDETVKLIQSAATLYVNENR